MPRMRSNGSNRCIRIFLFGIICISLVLNYRSHSEILATHLIHEEGFAIEFDAANNDNNVPDINSVALAGDQDHTGGTEQIVFAQLYERAKQSKEQCSRQYRTGANANTNHTKPALSLNTASFSNPQMMRNSSVGTQEEICHLPPKESCVSDYEYTAVVTFHASGNHTNISHRTLLMNLLALIAKDNFAFAATSSGTQSKSNNGPDADVIVLYHGSVENLNRDKMYGRRILNWHRDNTIRLVHESELVHDSNGSINNTRTEGILFYLFHESLVKYMQHDIILYLDGSVPFAGMGNGVGIGEVSVVDTLQGGFQLMRNNAQILVGNQLYHYSGISPLTTGIRNNAVATATNHDDFVLVCQDEATNTSSAHTQENEVSIMNFSGIFLHRNYLCFIWRDEFSALRELIGSMTTQYTTTSTSTSNANHSIIMELTSLFVTQVVTQVSGRSPLLYPLVKPSWSRNHNSQVDASTRRLSEIAVMDGGNVESHSDTPRRRRSNWVAPNDTVATFHHYTTEDRRKLSEIEGNHIMQPKSQSQSTQSVSSEDVLSILNYFGSYSKDPSCWCSSVDDQPPIVGSQTSCLSQCHPGHEGSDIISTKDLSWMTANKTRCK
mmetsp:Transcript_11837/g.17746  ORF Transcript_11837/g.17746 Transcript_11837/m.17746 type:complete len:608 (+) Transcript_11837:193-2016(+)